MKKVKKAVSVLFALIIIVSCATVSFAEAGIYEFNGKEYEYYGELSEGWNTVWEYNNRVDGTDYITDLYVYYSFSIPADGYYLLSYGTPHTDMNAQIYDEYDYENTLFRSYGVEKVYYLEKGDHKLMVDVYYSDVSVDIYTEYLGERITDISFNYDQLLDYDLGWYGTEGNYSFVSYADATITFSSGRAYEFSGGVLEGTTGAEPTDGKNNVMVEFLNQKISSTVTVYPVSHFVSNAELSNVEYYLENTVEYYNRLEKVYPYGETITVTFSDGTTQSIEYTEYPTYITLPNGQDYELKVYYHTDYSLFTSNTHQLEICLGYNCVMREYAVNGTKATIAENIKSLTNDNKEHSDLMFENTMSMLRSIGDEETFLYYSENVIVGFLKIYINCYDFFHYYTTFSFV